MLAHHHPRARETDVTTAAALTLAVCVQEAAECLDSVRVLLDNPVARDAAYTLHASGVSPAGIAILGGNDLCDEDVVLRLIARKVSNSLRAIIDINRGTPAFMRNQHAH